LTEQLELFTETTVNQSTAFNDTQCCLLADLSSSPVNRHKPENGRKIIVYVTETEMT